MRHVAAIVLAVGLVAGAAPAELCTKCKARAYTTDVGKCAACGGHTSSGAFKLCRKCSAKLRQCEHCRAKLPGAPKPKPAPATRPARIDPAKSATYTSGKWQYKHSVWLRGSNSEGCRGRLYYDGKELPAPGREDYYRTPWGLIHWVGLPRHSFGPHGWVPRPEWAKTGKELPAPGAATAPAKIDPTKSGRYASGKWRYELNVRDKPRVLRWGHLQYEGIDQLLPNSHIGNSMVTPWGKLYFVGTWRHPWGIQGWQPALPAGKKEGRRLYPKGKLAAERLKKLKANLEGFSFLLQYHGPQDKPYYSISLDVLAVHRRVDAFWPWPQISRAQARKLADALAQDGYLQLADDVTKAPPKPPAGPCYTLTVKVRHRYKRPPLALYEDIGWDLEMLGRLDGLRKVLEGDSGKAMDKLLARMAGHRKQWSKEAATRPATRPAGRGK